MPLTQRLVPALAMIAAAAPAMAQRIIPAVTDSARIAPPPYAEVAALVDMAPLVIDGTIRSAERLHGKDAAGTPPGTARLLVTIDLISLIRGDTALSARVSYVYLAPLGPHDALPKLRKEHVLLFAAPVAGSTDQVQLVRRDAQRDWTPALGERVRGIVKEAVAKDAPPTITGVGHAFHAAGTLPGEGTTQIFLATSDHRPISLTVERSASGERHWTVALGDIVGAGAPPPARDTLLWFRLACTLPAKLPEAALADASADDTAAVAADYAYVIDSLGPCSTGTPPA